MHKAKFGSQIPALRSMPGGGLACGDRERENITRKAGDTRRSLTEVLGLSLIAAFAAAGAAQAETEVGPTPSAPGAAVHFVDIKDRTTLPTKPTIHFGLRNMSVAPAGLDRENSGHRHLIIDMPTPPLDRPLPNEFNHLHFGAGKTEAQVTLTPGKHTLQLILGDKDHIPHNPPVMSERITVNVVDAARGAPAATRRPSPADASVYFVNVQNGSRIPPRTVIRFGLNNMGIAPAGVEKSNTGHHHLLIDTPLPPLDRPLPNDFNHLHFGAGQTEARIALNPGAHTLQLLFADENHVPHDPPVMSKPIKVTVAVPSAKKKKKKRRPRYSYSTQGLSAMTAVLELARSTLPGTIGRPVQCVAAS